MKKRGESAQGLLSPSNFVVSFDFIVFLSPPPFPPLTYHITFVGLLMQVPMTFYSSYVVSPLERPPLNNHIRRVMFFLSIISLKFIVVENALLKLFCSANHCIGISLSVSLNHLILRLLLIPLASVRESGVVGGVGKLQIIKLGFDFS